MSNVVVAFLPVIHKGVINFLKEASPDKVYLLTHDDVEGYDYLSREIRALSHGEAIKILASLGFRAVSFKDYKEELLNDDVQITMPEEDISIAIRSAYFKNKKIKLSQTFLRWDWSKSTVQATNLPEADRTIAIVDMESETIRKRLSEVKRVAEKSSDFWRQVGAMAMPVKENPIFSFNKHMPNEYVPYIDGDPRQSFKPGEYNDIYTSLHAEKGVISHAARKGISLEGADLYVTTFPCSDCANQIVETGIKRIFFTGGYSNLNGVKTLREHGVELIYVEL
jgi:dCMP deaminase